MTELRVGLAPATQLQAQVTRGTLYSARQAKGKGKAKGKGVGLAAWVGQLPSLQPQQFQ